MQKIRHISKNFIKSMQRNILKKSKNRYQSLIYTLIFSDCSKITHQMTMPVVPIVTSKFSMWYKKHIGYEINTPNFNVIYEVI